MTLRRPLGEVIDFELTGGNPASPRVRNYLRAIYTELRLVYTQRMAKRLVDIDDELLAVARDELGTATIKATVNEALRLAGASRSATMQKALDDLAMMSTFDRLDAWR